MGAVVATAPGPPGAGAPSSLPFVPRAACERRPTLC
jgi:hypothetical protein